MAAFWVVTLHFSPVLIAVLPAIHPLLPLANAGVFAVPLFFVLSGYVLGFRYGDQLARPRQGAVARFWLKRLGRVYPVHAVTLIGSLALVARHGWPVDSGHTRGSFIANVFLVQAWSRTLPVTWNYPSWSISSEWFAYLSFPVLAAVLARVHQTSRWALLATACVGSAWVYAAGTHLPFQGIDVVMPTFIGGCVLAMQYPVGLAVRAPRPRPWAEICILLLIALPFLVGPGAAQSAAFLIIFFALVGLLGSAGRDCAAFWRLRPLVYLGEISYSLYMTHALTITVLARFLPLTSLHGAPPVLRAAAIGGCGCVVIGVAAACHATVERPLRSLSRRLADAS